MGDRRPSPKERKSHSPENHHQTRLSQDTVGNIYACLRIFGMGTAIACDGDKPRGDYNGAL